MSIRVKEPKTYRLPDGRIGRVVYPQTTAEALEEWNRRHARVRGDREPIDATIDRCG